MFLYTVKYAELVSPLSRPTVTLGHTFLVPANYCNIVLGHYSVSWPPVYFKNFSQFHTLCNSLCVRSSPYFVWPNRLYIFAPFDTVQRPKSPFISRTASCPSNLILSPLVRTTDWNFLVGTDTSLYFKSLFIGSVLTNFSAFWAVHLHKWLLQDWICTVHVISTVLPPV